MKPQIPGIIYIASQRGELIDSKSTTYCTFNYGSFFQSEKASSSDVISLNETYINPLSKMEMHFEPHSFYLIILLYNSVVVKNNYNTKECYPGQAIAIKGIDTLEMDNSSSEYCSFLCLQMTEEKGAFPIGLEVLDLTIDQYREKLIDVVVSMGIKIGNFDARSEWLLSTSKKGKKSFFFNIEGSFEVGGRLLGPRDGLLLWDYEKIDLESLCSNSIILQIDC